MATGTKTRRVFEREQDLRGVADDVQRGLGARWGRPFLARDPAVDARVGIDFRRHVGLIGEASMNDGLGPDRDASQRRTIELLASLGPDF